ncbi:MAG: ABC transporter permease [Chlorobi bacterium]|nr:ABC transporter permease [Chlorobiota bacterium]
MQRIIYIVQKEFKQIFRNRMMKPMLFIMPFVQLAVLSYTADFTVKDIRIYVQDQDMSPLSAKLTSKIKASDNFTLKDVSYTYDEGFNKIQDNEIDVILSIPEHFSRNLNANRKTELFITADAINSTKAGISINYLQNIIHDFQIEEAQSKGLIEIKPGINTIKRDWYNPGLDYKFFMVPGILVLLVTMLALFLSGMNIVREKEVGTIEQLNVTPIRKYQFIIGKLLPFLIIGVFEFTVGLAVALLWFKVPFLGSVGVIYMFTIVYLILVLGIGMFISTITDTQQQALFLAWFFSVIFILMSGLFTPIESMPQWAQDLTLLNPIRYYVEVIRLVMLKGSSFASIKVNFLVITLSAIIINMLAIRNYKKTA